jgi:hypothetical protein
MWSTVSIGTYQSNLLLLAKLHSGIKIVISAKAFIHMLIKPKYQKTGLKKPSIEFRKIMKLKIQTDTPITTIALFLYLVLFDAQRFLCWINSFRLDFAWV